MTLISSQAKEIQLLFDRTDQPDLGHCDPDCHVQWLKQFIDQTHQGD
jgi:hypothetical protein